MLMRSNISSTYCWACAYRFSLMSTSSSFQSLETFLTLSIRAPLQTLAWDPALKKAFTSLLLKAFADDSRSVFCGRTIHNFILVSYLNAVSSELCQTLVFHSSGHLFLSFATRFSNMPYFRQSLSRYAMTKCYWIWQIYPNTLRINAYNS